MARALLLLLGIALLQAGVDLAVGYPELPWWQGLPHDLAEAATGVVIWHVVLWSHRWRYGTDD